MKPISGIVGLALMLASVIIVVLSTSDETYLDKQNTMVNKYITLSDEALEEDNIKDALKYAKLAIAVDPKNKSGFKAYENIIELKYKPNEDETSNEESPESPVTNDEEEDDEDMGC